jgi:hypothetical protein
MGAGSIDRGFFTQRFGAMVPDHGAEGCEKNSGGTTLDAGPPR